MLNQNFDGVITSISAKSIKKKVDGEKIKESVYIMKLETNDIDYESMTKFSSSTSATLLNIQPMPFDSVNFGDMTVINMSLALSASSEEETMITLDVEPDVELHKVKIKNLTVKNRGNIPQYIFTIQIPIESPAKFMFANLKKPISFKFDKEGE